MSDDTFIVRTPDGIVMGYGDVAKAKKLDVEAATIDPITELRRADRLPDPASLTVGDVADALAFMARWGDQTPNLPIRDAVIRRDALLGASPGFAILRGWLQANLGVNPSTEAMQVVISDLAKKLRKPFDAVRSIPLTDAVKLLDHETPNADRPGAGKTNEGKGETAGSKARQEGAAEPTEGGREADDAPLSEDQRYFLIAMCELAAFDSDNRRTSRQIVTRAKGRWTDTANAKRALAGLVRKSLCKSLTGANGGYWLTAEGKARAQRLKKSIG